MGEIFVHDDDWNRQIRTDDPYGRIEIDLTDGRPEVVVPECVSVRTREPGEQPSGKRPTPGG